MGAILYFFDKELSYRNFALIFFKIAYKVESCLPLFAIESQLDKLVIPAYIITIWQILGAAWPNG